ncbi:MULTISPECIES: hypothetical protein [Bacteroides]|uniref:hypothetical protein n=2 Tax=Bacteroides TaxID=816 RepID=UPI001F3B4611|nr:MULTISPECIES: hypothetical protein [Bacteroides]MCS2585238.1 hypothetical protein [Bacteroides sp. BFG-551]
MKQFLKLIATGEEMVKLLPFTRKLLIHRGNREKMKGELKRWEIDIQWEKLFDSVMIQYYTPISYMIISIK